MRNFKMFLIFILILFSVSFAIAGEKKIQEPQKFNLKIVIEYQQLTLEQIVKIEKEIKKNISDAKSIELKIDKNDENGTVFYNQNFIPTSPQPKIVYD